MNTPPLQRLPYLDGLRVVAFLLLVPYHVGMYYVSWDWHVKSAAASSVLEPFMLLTAPWRLGLLFLVAGAACQGLAARRSTPAALKDRTLRLLLPLFFGMAVVVPPQAYFELLTKAPALLPGDGGYLDFWLAYLHGGRYCRGSDCLDVPTWNHLWFIAYLWPYTVAGIVLAALQPGLSRLSWRPVLPGWACLLLPAVLLALARVFVFPHHPSTHNLFHDLYNHVQYGGLFALGWLSRTPVAGGLWAAALRWRWAALGAALAGWAVLVAYFIHYADSAPPHALLVAQRVLWGTLSWCAIVAACGWAQRVFTVESPGLRRAGAAVFCLYVLHQTVIVLLTQALRPLALPWGLEAVLLIVLTLAICALAYAVLRRVPGLALLTGIQRRPQTDARWWWPVSVSSTAMRPRASVTSQRPR